MDSELTVLFQRNVQNLVVPFRSNVLLLGFGTLDFFHVSVRLVTLRVKIVDNKRFCPVFYLGQISWFLWAELLHFLMSFIINQSFLYGLELALGSSVFLSLVLRKASFSFCHTLQRLYLFFEIVIFVLILFDFLLDRLDTLDQILTLTSFSI